MIAWFSGRLTQQGQYGKNNGETGDRGAWGWEVILHTMEDTDDSEPQVVHSNNEPAQLFDDETKIS